MECPCESAEGRTELVVWACHQCYRISCLTCDPELDGTCPGCASKTGSRLILTDDAYR